MSSKPSRRYQADDFTCIHCDQSIDAQTFGTRHRNHCPLCLWSRHVDETPGDRRSACRARCSPSA